MTNNASNLSTIASILSDDPHFSAKLDYLRTVEGCTKPAARAKPPEQLVSPADHIQLSLMILVEEAAALRALLDAPVLLPAHQARAQRAVQAIETAALAAESNFRIAKPRYTHREVYRRARRQP